ncbi:O-antigen ligase domain-containing protein [Leptolyngbya sp. FACHB-261]|uniref:O-antigen ligase domain-containing protein n=1 Tax=Leptolyngbya sp. FACHB-261 TaxID=2692806 RepID=UPI001683A150|nr:O-antigen ligase domain-containing protein [Leptolyngbya sp. FACHB-261]MBD2103242.1 O-antigen ligase domain-containing protein [Leptolyngbya sp. FACHB-261]
MKPQNLEEKVVWYYIIGTYLLYFLGAQHISAPAIAWLLVLYLGKKLWQQTDQTPVEDRVRIPLGVWVWAISILFIELALVMGLSDFGADTFRIVKSSINGFARTWALLALFPLVGCLNIRFQLLSRAICILCLQSLLIIPVLYLLSQLNLPGILYTSPLLKIGGIGPEYYNVGLYVMESTGRIRLQLFAPWSPAMGLVGNVCFVLASQEPDRKWRWIGMIGAIAMTLVSVSRLGLVCLFFVPIATYVLARVSRPQMQIAAGVGSFFGGLFGFQLLSALRDFKNYFDSQRARSSEIRELLGRIALYRWWNDAPIWGHGLKERRGPELVVFKPIGSHHTWFGVLFTHGLVGFMALAIPFAWSFIELLLKAQTSKIAQAGLSVILVLFLYSFGENLESLAYVYWPGLVSIGLALKEKRMAASLPSQPMGVGALG